MKTQENGDSKNIKWLKSNYFNNPDQIIDLKAGEKITHQGQSNDRLYYVISGKLTGYFKTEKEEKLDIFNAYGHMIVGIYSFFSEEGQSYTTVEAREDSKVVYLKKDQVPAEDDPGYGMFLKHMLPMLVKEIYLRQMTVVKRVSEKESVLKKLYQSEKLATLGQLSAGLAHELNNAIGVITNKAIILKERFMESFDTGDPNGVYRFFLKGLENGQSLSSSEIRNRKKQLVKQLSLNDKLAKKLARISLDDEEINFIAQRRNEAYIRKIDYFWETGLALHDMQIAADHTSHVIRSIKDLGSQNQSEVIICDLGSTVQKSLALLTNLVKRVKLNLEIEEGLTVLAREGDLIQVWVNLIKNAIESLLNSNVTDPEIFIKSEVSQRHFKISVIDNGPGVPANLLTKIFQPNVTTKVHGLSFGLGLGLSIVQKIVTSYGGSIELESVPGKTEFKVKFTK